MIWITGHPGFRRLNRFADGELGGGEHTRVARHLARCGRCREEVGLMRRIGDAVRGLPTPAAPQGIFREAMSRRESGERVLLPKSDPGAVEPRRRSDRIPAAIAAMLTALVLGFAVSVRVLEADKPTFGLLPERPVAGEVLRVEYQGGARFADQSHLKLRARYRTPDNRSWHLLAGVLVRGDDGVFRTEVALPDSVVYAAFAVEDLHGHRLDSNNQRLWEILVHGPDRRPTIDAMTAQIRDLEGRDWGAAYDLAVEMTRAYPDSPRSWAVRYSFEATLFDPDSVAALHRQHFERLERALSSGTTPTGDDAAWLASYALVLGDVASGMTWIQRAQVHGATTPVLYDARVMLAASKLSNSPTDLLEELERIWVESPMPLPAGAALGWSTARLLRSQAPEATRHWVKRYLITRPVMAGFLPEANGALPSDHRGPGDVLARLGESVRETRSANEGTRPLSLSQASHVRWRAERAQDLLVLLSEVALQIGDSAQAESFSRHAIDYGSNSFALLRAGNVLLALGERDSALDAFAAAAADPLTEEEALGRASLILDAPEYAAWAPDVSRRRAKLREHVMDGAIVRYLSTATHEMLHGTVEAHHDVATPIIVVGFLDSYSPTSREHLRQVDLLNHQLKRLGSSMLAVDVRGAGTLSLLPSGTRLDIPVHLDPDGTMRAEFRSSRVPDYFIVDQMGRIRFEHSDITEVIRQVDALRSAAGMVALAE